MTLDTRPGYVMDTGTELGHQQVTFLGRLLDATTTGFLDEIGVQPGWRCLDLGAGGGSVTRWLAERTGPGGTVVAVDLNTDHLEAGPGVEVHRHDINDGLPVAGGFQLIHARLVFMHLPRRLEVLRTLVDALAPGGWLVIGDFSDRPRRVLAAPSDADARLFDRVQGYAHDVVMRYAGSSLAWAHEIDGHLAGAGLTDLDSLAYSVATAGGGIGCLLHDNYARQVEHVLLDAGFTAEELDRYHALMRDPRFRAWFYEFVCTRGRVPA